MSGATLRVRLAEDGVVEVFLLGVGAVRGLPSVGSALGPRAHVGVLDALGTRVTLELPHDAPFGQVVERAPSKRTSAPFGYGALLFRYRQGGDAALSAETRSATSLSGALVFRAPMAGRFYRRTAPDKPALVEVGEVVETGRALGLVEVMKTFHRVGYGGEGLPARAKISAALVEDGADVAEGDALFALEPSAAATDAG